MYLPYPEFRNLVESGLNLGASHTFQYNIPLSTKFGFWSRLRLKSHGCTLIHTNSYLPCAFCVKMLLNCPQRVHWRLGTLFTVDNHHKTLHNSPCSPLPVCFSVTGATSGSHFTLTTEVHIAQHCNIKFLFCVHNPPT
jgi:hypothetical protein